MKRMIFRMGLVVVLLAICVLAFKYGGRPVEEPAVVWAAEAELVSADPNCRYGVASVNVGQPEVVPVFHAGWFLTFEAEAPPGAPDELVSEFAHVVNVRQNKSNGVYLPGWYIYNLPLPQLEDLVEENPGELWLIGNEVDRGPDPGQIMGGQGDMEPDAYAEAYHDLYFFIKEIDPTAQIGISALVQVTPARIWYLDTVWQAYYDQFGSYMPVDVWNMHLYILPEAEPNGVPNGIANKPVSLPEELYHLLITSSYDPDGSGPLTLADSCPDDGVYCFAEHDNLAHFKAQIVAMRVWMKEHYQQNRPLILSEYSLLYPYVIDQGGSCFLQDEFGECFTPERVSNFAADTLNYLQFEAIDPELGYPADNYRLVQQWLWFSIYNDAVGQSSSLIESDLETLTLAGETWVDYIEALPANVNLWPAQVPPQWVDIVSPAITADATLVAWVANNGNKLAPPFTVTFYSNAARTEEIGSTTVDRARGCGRDRYLATVTWNDLTAGVHPFWVKVDSANAVGETNESDNVGVSFVMVDGHQLYLPAVRNQP